MSDLHGDDERPEQWRVPCYSAAMPAPTKRMHSLLRDRHLADVDMDIDSDEKYIQCNACGNIRAVK